MSPRDRGDICDFSRSYMTFFLSVNNARIQIVSRCLITDERSGETSETVLIWPCKSEFMYLDNGLYQSPNYDFCGVWSQSEFLILRTYAAHDATRRGEWDAGLNKDRFDNVKIDISTYPVSEKLTSDVQIVRATLENRPLVARTHLRMGQSAAVVEYPVTTMNVVNVDSADPNAGRFQVDTGPVLVPAWCETVDVPSRGDLAVEQFDLAFICYNRLEGHTELVIRAPATTSGGETVWHYSHVVPVEARHEIFACS